MSIPALLNVALLSARKGAAEIEFAVKKVHTLDVTKKGPADYTTAIDRRVEKIVLEEIKRFYPDDNFLGEETGEEIGLKRLEARPVATYTLEAQERREITEKQFKDTR